MLLGHEWQPGLVASTGGADDHPDWYLNLEFEPDVELEVADEEIAATARTASREEKQRLWPTMAGIWSDHDEYVKRTDRGIPVVILTPV